MRPLVRHWRRYAFLLGWRHIHLSGGVVTWALGDDEVVAKVGKITQGAEIRFLDPEI